MASRKEIELNKREALEETEPMDDMTVAVEKATEKYQGPTVEVILPELPGSGDGSTKVDPYEHVTIANMEKETCYKVLRGESVPVPVPVFMALKAKYPKC